MYFLLFQTKTQFINKKSQFYLGLKYWLFTKFQVGNFIIQTSIVQEYKTTQIETMINRTEISVLAIIIFFLI